MQAGGEGWSSCGKMREKGEGVGEEWGVWVGTGKGNRQVNAHAFVKTTL